MGYNTYSTVSWSDGTPITSDRLQQMSSNSEAIKTTTDEYAQGLLAHQEYGTSGSAITDTSADKVIGLDSSSSWDNSGDNRVTIGANRWLKITFSISGVEFTDLANGAIGAGYYFKLVEGTASSDTTVAQWYFATPDEDASDMKTTGGAYTVMLDSGATGKTNVAYTVFMSRESGATSYKTLASSTSKKQLFAEDCGKKV